MPRPPRLQVAGGTYHVTSRGNRGSPSTTTITTGGASSGCGTALSPVRLARSRLLPHGQPLSLVGRNAEAESLIRNATAEVDYADYFNERHSLDGHLFEQRFVSRLIESEEYFFEALRYIALNPVRVGLCEHPAEWPWSSFYGAVRDSLFDRVTRSSDLRTCFGV